MDKIEALAIIGVSENSSNEEITAKFNELYNDYHIRLTNAPTPNLKKLYQKNLQELNEAKKILIGDEIEKLQDLPSSTPLYQKSVVRENPKSSSEQITSKVQSNENQKAPSSVKVAFIFGFIAILSIALAVYFGVNMSETTKEMDKLSEMKQNYDGLSQKVKLYDAMFSNGKFKVKNNGNNSFKIGDVIVVYKNTKNELVKYFDNVNAEVKAGSIKELSKISGNDVEWDGSVISYYFDVEYTNNKGDKGSMVYSGIWSMEAAEGKPLILNFDNI
jgi:hypothetical protein